MERVGSSAAGRDAVYATDTVLPSVHEVIGVQSSFSIHSEPEAGHEDEEEPEAGSHDKFAHTRGKRKRTSREDFHVLEAAYQRNPRPDKATRTDIVSRVSLSEKEVQIWFQNRRQMTRRKCRTWQPNEITSIIRSSQQNTSSVSGDQSTLSEDVVTTTSSRAILSHERARPSADSLSQLVVHDDTSDSRPMSSHPPSQLCSTELESEQDNTSFGSQGESEELIGVQGKNNGGDASDSSLLRDSNLDKTSSPSDDRENSETYKSTQNSGLKRKSSAIRLSLSFSGKAEVVLGSESPSPPKKAALGETRGSRVGPLQRSQSAISPSAAAHQPLGTDMPMWRRSRALGRSRDARTWEFYCDSDARNALTKTAEHDQKGTAQGVLGLIRSGSNARKPLAPVRRENVSLQRIDSASSSKSVVRKTSRPKLSRSSSSMPRLQTVATLESNTTSRKTKLDKEIEIWQDNFGDSDKENHDPEEGARGGRPADFAGAHNSNGSRRANADARLSDDKENPSGRMDTSDAPSLLKHGRVDEELDAVQNLLRLSQGDWR